LFETVPLLVEPSLLVIDPLFVEPSLLVSVPLLELGGTGGSLRATGGTL